MAKSTTATTPTTATTTTTTTTTTTSRTTITTGSASTATTTLIATVAISTSITANITSAASVPPTTVSTTTEPRTGATTAGSTTDILNSSTTTSLDATESNAKNSSTAYTTPDLFTPTEQGLSTTHNSTIFPSSPTSEVSSTSVTFPTISATLAWSISTATGMSTSTDGTTIVLDKHAGNGTMVPADSPWLIAIVALGATACCGWSILGCVRLRLLRRIAHFSRARRRRSVNQIWGMHPNAVAVWEITDGQVRTRNSTRAR